MNQRAKNAAFYITRLKLCISRSRAASNQKSDWLAPDLGFLPETTRQGRSRAGPPEGAYSASGPTW